MSSYSILGISDFASLSEIKEAHRKLVKKHHPDFGGKKDIFFIIQEAYESISTNEKKESYDRKLRDHSNEETSGYHENIKKPYGFGSEAKIKNKVKRVKFNVKNFLIENIKNFLVPYLLVITSFYNVISMVTYKLTFLAHSQIVFLNNLIFVFLFSIINGISKKFTKNYHIRYNYLFSIILFIVTTTFKI